uniref:Ig-like domain-containing protein n=1 Tax=Loa loa TaxID=7209 RepID=A0A1I7W2X2_LOALO
MKRQVNEPKLGDHFELILPKLSRKDMGWYRCIRRMNNTIINNSVKDQMQAMQHKFANFKLQSNAVATPWSECSNCDTREGEKRRKIACHLSVPCRRAKIEQTRLIMGKNEFGRNIIIDEIPPGEYQMNERLPPLRKAVKRKTIQALENDPYILSCPQKEFGIFWALNETYISSTSLLVQYPDKRIYIDGDNQLIINYLKLEDDESFFSCHRAYDGDVLRTFSFIVNKGKQRQEIVEYVNFGIRF